MRHATLYLTPVVIGLLVGSAAFFGSPEAWAESPNATAPVSNDSEKDVLEAIARALAAMQRHQPRDAIDQVEHAEVALLNLGQGRRDPHVDASLARLETAKMAIQKKDERQANQALAEAAEIVPVALAVGGTNDGTAAPGQPQLVGDTVYDADEHAIGPVIAVVADPAADIPLVVISIGDFAGSADKNVAVPRSDLTMQHDHLTLDRSKDQLRQAASYRPSRAEGTGSSNLPRNGGGVGESPSGNPPSNQGQ